MGTDAQLMTKSKKSFYYDREYNIAGYNSSCNETWDKWTQLSPVGLSKTETIKYLNKRAIEIKNDPEEEKDRKEMMLGAILQCIAFVETLEENDIIYSRHENQDEYHSYAYERVQIAFQGTEIEMRICIDCGERLPIDFFGTRLGKVNKHCLKCGRERSRKSYQKNLEKNREKRKQWIEDNRPRHNEIAKEYQRRKKQKNLKKSSHMDD